MAKAIARRGSMLATRLVNSATKRVRKTSFDARLTLPFTDEQRKEFRELFDDFDKDQNGVINREEMALAMTHFGLSHTDEDIRRVMMEVDLNRDGEIDFQEFCLAILSMTNLKQKQSQDDVIKECFEVFDRDGNGLIREEEFCSICKELDALSTPVSQRVFKEANVSGDGNLSFEEFQMMASSYMFEED